MFQNLAKASVIFNGLYSSMGAPHPQGCLPQARCAGAKMEPMLVGQRQYQPLSMDIFLHFTPLFMAKHGEFGIKKQPLFYKTWRTLF